MALAGKVVFSTDNPANLPTSDTGSCVVPDPVTSVKADTSVWATYFFGTTQLPDNVSFPITKDGVTDVGSTTLQSAAQFQGYVCYYYPTDLKELVNWGPGAYHFTIVIDGVVIGEGDLTVQNSL